MKFTSVAITFGLAASVSATPILGLGHLLGNLIPTPASTPKPTPSVVIAAAVNEIQCYGIVNQACTFYQLPAAKCASINSTCDQLGPTPSIQGFNALDALLSSIGIDLAGLTNIGNLLSGVIPGLGDSNFTPLSSILGLSNTAGLGQLSGLLSGASTSGGSGLLGTGILGPGGLLNTGILSTSGTGGLLGTGLLGSSNSGFNLGGLLQLVPGSKQKK